MEQENQKESDGGTTYNILFVCTGNTCRSPMAAAVARREVETREWPHIRTASAGVSAHPGGPASGGAIRALAGIGIDISHHRSRPLTADLIEWADLILAMSPRHLDVIDALGGGQKAALLGDFAEGHRGGGSPVSDPFGGDDATYRDTLAELEDLVARSIDRLGPILQP